MTFHLTITTPEQVLIDDEVSEVIVPTAAGEVAILPGHTELVSSLSEGTVTIIKNGQPDYIALMGGFLQVDQKKVEILANFAVTGKDKSVVELEEAKKRAEKNMKEHASEQDFALAESEFKKAILELQAARKHKTN